MNKYTDILADQKSELAMMLGEKGIVARKKAGNIVLESTLAQIVTGIRRCGKSVLCRTALAKAGVDFGYVNFDQPSLASVTADDLNEILKAVYVVYGDVRHLFFDEIQNVPSWQLFVNMLLRQGKRVVLTGSNSRLLTDDFATHLTGRFIGTELMPFSFGEYRAWLKRGEAGTTAEKAQLRRDYDRYFLHGGMPESFAYPDIREYASTLYHSILMRDVLQRHRLRDTKRFLDTAYVIMNNFASEISCNRLAKQLGFKNAVTVQSYVGYLAESYLVRTLAMYGSKAYERTRIGKAYAIDPGFISYFSGFSNTNDNFGRRLENIVFLQLYRLQRDTDAEVFYWKDERHEVDFLLRRYNQVWKLVQVSYDISNEKTRKRELSALFAAGAKLKCSDLTLLTDHENGEEKKGGMTVRIVDVVSWLQETEAGKWTGERDG
jgi:hypothetical protein